MKILLSNIHNKPDIIALSETWIPTKDTKFYSIVGYNFVLLPRSNKRGGGVGVYLNNNITYTVRSDLTDSAATNSFEVLLIEINVINSLPILILNCYRPPSTSISVFNLQLSALLDSINDHCLNVRQIVLGDFNVNLLDSSATGRPTQNFLDLMATSNLYILSFLLLLESLLIMNL